jgi:hypothetical protein
MRPVKHGPNIIQSNADSGPSPRPDNRSHRKKQCFDIPPRDIGPDRLCENVLQRPALLGIHTEIVLCHDTTVKENLISAPSLAVGTLATVLLVSCPIPTL